MNSLIADGCIINGSTLYSSILFPLVRVESFCHIEDSVILPDVTVNHHCYLKRCIIDRSCTIPEGTVIGMDAEDDAARFHRTEEGIVLVTREMLEQLVRKENSAEKNTEQKTQNEEAFS